MRLQDLPQFIPPAQLTESKEGNDGGSNKKHNRLQRFGVHHGAHTPENRINSGDHYRSQGPCPEGTLRRTERIGKQCLKDQRACIYGDANFRQNIRQKGN